MYVHLKFLPIFEILKKSVPFVYMYYIFFEHVLASYKCFSSIWEPARFACAHCEGSKIRKIQKNPDFWEFIFLKFWVCALCTQIMNSIIDEKEVSKGLQKNILSNFETFWRFYPQKRLEAPPSANKFPIAEVGFLLAFLNMYFVGLVYIMRATPRAPTKLSVSVYMMLNTAPMKYHICTKIAH